MFGKEKLSGVGAYYHTKAHNGNWDKSGNPGGSGEQGVKELMLDNY
jgi:hypothetical protein